MAQATGLAGSIPAEDDADLGLDPGIDHDWPAVAASAVCLVFSVGTILLYSFGVFVWPLAHTFGWNRTQISGAVTIGQYAFALTSPFWGMLADRFGPRRIVLPSVVGLALGVASLAWLTPHLWHFYLTFALIPVIGGGASPLGYGAILVRRFERRLGLALGLALMGVGLGATLLSPLAQALVGHLGWRSAYAVLGGLTLLLTLPSAAIASRHTRRPAAARRRATFASILPLLRTRAFILMCVAFALAGLASVGMLAHLVPMMIDRGFAPPAAASLAAITGMAAIVARGGLGFLLDRLFAPRVFVGVCGVGAGAALLLGYGRTPLPSYAAALLLGLVVGAEVDFVAYLVRRYFGPVAFGRLYGIAFGLFILGSGTGPLLLGISFDHLGGYKSGLLLFACLFAAAAVVVSAMPRYSANEPNAV